MAILDSLKRFYASSIGKKIVVAITGIILFGFLAGHLAGNLLVYLGPEATNKYAATLKSLPEFLWPARLTLLASFIIHIVTTVQLTLQNRASRNVRYASPKTAQASLSSRFMIVSGFTVLCFVLFHLGHYTLHVGNEFGTEKYIDAEGRHDVYSMVIDGFSNKLISLFYLTGMVLLCSHLGHGVSSVFQTLGLATDRNWPLIKKAGNAYALVLFLGFASIPLSVIFGFLSK